MSSRRPELTRPPEIPALEFAAFAFARLSRGSIVREGPPETFIELAQSADFKAAATRELKDFAVSGAYDKEHRRVIERSDLDGETSLGLLELAGFDVSKVKYVLPGESVPGFFNIDTGYVHGIFTGGNPLDEDRLKEVTAWCDNHGKESKQGSSSAAFMYEALTELGFLVKHEALDHLIDYVNRMESAEVDWPKEFSRSDKTLVGLGRFMTTRMLVDYFLRGNQYTDTIPEDRMEAYSADPEFLSQDFLKQRTALVESDKFKNMSPEKQAEAIRRAHVMTLRDRASEQRRVIEMSAVQTKKLTADGLMIPTKYGKTLVVPADQGYALWGGYGAAYAAGADVYMVWNPGGNSFVISLRRGELKETFDQGLLVRDHIWIRPGYLEGRMNISLREILNAIGVKGHPSPAMREVLGRDEAEMRGVFEVEPRMSDSGNYIGYIDGVFALFPKEWKRPKGAATVPVRVATVRRDKRDRPYFTIEPVAAP